MFKGRELASEASYITQLDYSWLGEWSPVQSASLIREYIPSGREEFLTQGKDKTGLLVAATPWSKDFQKLLWRLVIDYCHKSWPPNTTML